MSLSTVPDLCLFTIFDRVPVHDLYHTVPLVCKRWTTLRDTACHQRKTLILLESECYLPCAVDSKHKLNLLKHAIQEDGTPFKSETISSYYHNSCLVCPFYFAEQSKLIRFTRLFPRVETLKIIHLNLSVYELCKMYVMFKSWSKVKSLKKLQLFLRFDKFTDDDEIDENKLIKLFTLNIMDCINRMKNSLKNLSLNIGFPRKFIENVSFDLTILSNLETFSYDLFGLGSDQHDKNEPLRYLQTNNSIRKISIAHTMKLEGLVKLCPEVARKFGEILIDDEIEHETIEKFKIFCSKFTSLTALTVFIGGREFRQVIRSVTKLKQLIHLGMQINLNFEDQEDEGEEEAEREHEVLQLPSIVALSLYVETKSHHDLAQLDLPAIMPNVQVILLRHDSPHCTECGYGPFTLEQVESFVEEGKQDQVNPPMIEKMQQCMKQARSSLIGFEKLKKLEVNKLPMIFMNDDETDYALELNRDELSDEL